MTTIVQLETNMWHLIHVIYLIVVYKLDQNYKTQVYIPLRIISQGVSKVGTTDWHHERMFKLQNSFKM